MANVFMHKLEFHWGRGRGVLIFVLLLFLFFLLFLLQLLLSGNNQSWDGVVSALVSPQFKSLLIGHEAYFSKGNAVATILQEGNIAFMQIIILKMRKLINSRQKSRLVKKFLGFGFGVVLLQMRFLLFGHAIVQIVLRIE